MSLTDNNYLLIYLYFILTYIILYLYALHGLSKRHRFLKPDLPRTQRQNETHIRIYYISDYMKYWYSQRSAKGLLGRSRVKAETPGRSWSISCNNIRFLASCAILLLFLRFVSFLPFCWRNYIVIISFTCRRLQTGSRKLV